jgi:peptide/nickel transport system substrate-binding protein
MSDPQHRTSRLRPSGRRVARTRRLTAVVTVTLGAVLALSGCTPPAPETSAHPDYELTAQTDAPSGDLDSFSWVSYAEPYSLDYAYAFDYADNQVLANVCESLLRLNPDYTLSPGLAESFAHPTPETWVYTIRDGVSFHDGSPLTPADVVASMRRHLDPAVGSSWYSVYQNVTSIEQTGDREVTVTEASADSQFNLAMGGSAGVVESAATLTEAGADYGNSTGGVNCTGPFSLAEWKAGERITLTRFDDYWDESLRAKSGEVEFLFMNDANARVNALASGEVDGGWMVPLEAVPQLENSSVGDQLFGLNTAVWSLIVSDLDGPLADVNVRKALLMALDREGIVSAAAKGYGEVTDALTTESVWVGASDAAESAAFDGLEEYPYDPRGGQAARRGRGRGRRGDRVRHGADQQRLQRDRAGDRGSSPVDRVEGHHPDGDAQRVHGALLRSERTRGHRPLRDLLVPFEPRPARDVQRAAHGRVQQLRRLVRPGVRPGRQRGDRDRRPRRPLGEDRGGAAHSERGAALASALRRPDAAVPG